MSIFPQIGDCVRTESNVIGIVTQIKGTMLYVNTQLGEFICSITKARVIPRGGYFYRYARKSISPTCLHPLYSNISKL